MEYKKLEEINKTLKTTEIKGKNYVEVNTRIKAFWQLFPDGRIHTQIVTIDNGMCVIKAEVYENKEQDYPRATGLAYEKEGSTFINKTSYIENCETSAVGRALGNAGIGIDTSVASAEEVQNAIIQQNEDKKINKTQEESLYKIVKDNELENDDVISVLEKYNYKKFADIKVTDLIKIQNELKEV